MRHLNSRAAIAGIGELKPKRHTKGVNTLDLLLRVSAEAARDAGLEPSEIDGLLVGPQVGETPQHVPATVAEYFGMQPTMSNVVDLGGASGSRHDLARGGRHRGRDVRNRALRSRESP